MTKQWKPGRETVALRPSRIRREPVRLEAPKTVVRAHRSRERDIWTAILGIGLFAISVVTIVVGVSMATNRGIAEPAVAAAPARFDYCHGTRQADCVLAGDTFLLGTDKVAIAGIYAPHARFAACSGEARLGVDAMVRLRRILNEGSVSLGFEATPAADGAMSRRVEVNGVDIGRVMVAAGLARDARGGTRSWC